jgi:hypothetical protein
MDIGEQKRVIVVEPKPIRRRRRDLPTPAPKETPAEQPA